MAKLSGNENVFYTIIDGFGLNKTIRINRYWREFLLKNYSVIRSWVQYNKAQVLQIVIQEFLVLYINYVDQIMLTHVNWIKQETYGN